MEKCATCPVKKCEVCPRENMSVTDFIANHVYNNKGYKSIAEAFRTHYSEIMHSLLAQGLIPKMLTNSSPLPQNDELTNYFVNL